MKTENVKVVATVRDSEGVSHEFTGEVEVADAGGYILGSDLEGAIVAMCGEGSKVLRVKEVAA